MQKLFTVLLLFTLAACASPSTTPTARPLTPVQLAMGYNPDIQFAPFYVAAEKGYFREAGIEIEFVTMYEDTSVPLLGKNELQFANVSAEQVIQARAQGLPVKYVLKWWEQYPIAVVSKADTGIKSPADLKGRKVGIPGLFGASYVGWRALLNAAGLPEDAVQLEAIGFTQTAALTQNQVEAVIVYANNEPVQLAAAGQPLNVIYISDYVKLASNGLATNEQTIKDRPALVAGMVTAFRQGLQDTLADPEAALQISLNYIDPPPPADVARQVLAASIKMWQTDQPGVSDKARWETTQSVLLEMGLIPAPIDLDQAFTNQFIQ